MSNKEKSIALINERIKNKQAMVLTDRELLEQVEKGRNLKTSDIDVVTTAWHARMPGTSCHISIPVAERSVFVRAKYMWLNGVIGFPGPAPNERLGLINTQIAADQLASENNYSGAKLFLDIISRKEIEVECLSVEGDTYWSTFTLDQLQFARMIVYNCFLEQLGARSKSHNLNEHLRTVRAGNTILLNRAPGIVVGCGTRSAPQRRSLSLAADMFEMDAKVMTEFRSDSGIEITNSIALAIPVINDAVPNDFVECLREMGYQQSKKNVCGPHKEMASYLQELILRGEFVLTDSHAELEHWI